MKNSLKSIFYLLAAAIVVILAAAAFNYAKVSGQGFYTVIGIIALLVLAAYIVKVFLDKKNNAEQIAGLKAEYIAAENKARDAEKKLNDAKAEISAQKNTIAKLSADAQKASKKK